MKLTLTKAKPGHRRRIKDQQKRTFQRHVMPHEFIATSSEFALQVLDVYNSITDALRSEGHPQAIDRLRADLGAVASQALALQDLLVWLQETDFGTEAA